MRIFLIGMPGSGKSTLGKELARSLKLEFIDLDQYIEKQACMFIDEIFESYGEDYFRALESRCLEDMNNLDNVIVSTGGGIIKKAKNKDIMQGICIFLDVPVTTLEKRVGVSTTIRPLLKTKSVSELYNERINLYRNFADITVTNINVLDTIKEITSYVKGISD